MVLPSLVLAAVVPLSSVLEGRYDYREVELEVRVADAFADPMGGTPRNRFLILEQDGQTIYMPAPERLIDEASVYGLVGSRVRVKGLPCLGSRQPNRRYTGRIFAWLEAKNLEVLSRGGSDPFDVPELPCLMDLAPEDYPTLGRGRLSGRVLAVWGGENLLVATASNDVMRVALARPEPPRVGEVAEFAGVPETDTYRLILSRAAWRPSAAEIPLEDSVAEISARQLDPRHYGRMVRISGHVRTAAEPGQRLVVESDGRLVPIETDAIGPTARELEKDSRVEVTGICAFHIAPWRRTAPFPEVSGFSLVPRSADDVRVLAAPPWWTPGRFLVVLLVLVVLLAGAVIWNRALQTVASRRGRELMRERMGSVRSRLKVLERTRLAVELHDTLSQTLAGVAMQIETAMQFPEGASPELLNHLDIADRALDSCRNELRNCLWDLRSETLDETDMSEAIRKTLLPHCANVELVIRFNVSRRLLSDNTVHSLLQIIRELALNGIRHGGATRVKIAGAYENGSLLFSVSDNGRGFVLSERPGIAQGHFGLEGVKSRVAVLHGRFAIESTRGAGTKATVSIAAADEKEEGEVD